MQQDHLLAGVSRFEIKPPIGLPLLGYGNRLLPNLGEREPLTATALSLRHGSVTVTIVACDLLAITDATYQLVQQQIPHPVLICCSHTHSGPVTHSNANTPQAYTTFTRWMVEQIIRAVRDSAANLQPITITQGTSETRIAVNRRQRNPDGTITIGVNPDGTVDRSVTTLQVHNTEGKLLGTLVNIACHPTVLDPGNSQASADWVGILRAIIEHETNAPVIFIQGACADLNPRLNHQPANRWNIRFQIGQQAAQDTLTALRNAQPIAANSLHHTGRYINLPIEPGSPTDFQQSVVRQFPLAATPLLDRFFPWQATSQQGSVPMRVDVVKLGDIKFIGMGAEVFNKIGTQLKSPGDIVAGVTNGCIGYLPTPEEHALGGYEVDIAPYFFRLPGRLRHDAATIAIEAINKT